MSLYLDNFKNQPPISVIKDGDIAGLSIFKKSLEKLFFSQVVIRNSASDGQNVKLVIEISCNFNLWEGISNLNEGIWAQYRTKHNKGFEGSHFYQIVTQLQSKNKFAIDVEEFSIIFNNSNIVINKIYERSISEQLDAILTRLSHHYVRLTKESIETPFEIFIPVFEENQKGNTDGESSLLVNIRTDNNKKQDYFKYWGLYFNSEEDALIYDLEKSAIVSGELYMLNL